MTSRERLLAAGLVALVIAPAPAEAQTPVSQRFGIDADAYVRVYLPAGEVRVTGWEQNTIAVTGTVDRGRFYAGGSGKTAKLGVWEEPGAGRLDVRVPTTATVWIKTASAEVSVSGVSGGLDVYSVTGRIRIEGSPRQLYVESMGGDLVLLASAPSIRAKTAAGAIDFRGRAEDLLLSTVSGPIEARSSVSPLRARLESVTGAVSWRGSIERGGSLDVQTHSGTVELGLPTALDAEISASTVKGSVVAGPLADGSSTTIPPGRTFERLAGAGGARIDVRTFSGDVVFR